MTRIPHVPERMKEAPAHALRAVFTGIGQALLMSDRVRRKLKSPHDPDEDGASDAVRLPISRPTAVRPEANARVTPIAEAARARSATKTAATSATRTAAQAPAKLAATATPYARAPVAKAAQAPTAKAAAEAAKPAATGAPHTAPPATQPPIMNYDELSLASLRARLRGLDLAKVRQLLSYERSHDGRSEVITMYERRIAKLREADG
jgi:hypothetical protein